MIFAAQIDVLSDIFVDFVMIQIWVDYDACSASEVKS